MLVDTDVALGGDEVEQGGAPASQIKHGSVGARRDFAGEQPVPFGGPLARDRELRRPDKRSVSQQPTANARHRPAMLLPAILTAWQSRLMRARSSRWGS